MRVALAGERQAFSIVATLTSGTPPFNYQWLRNGVAIPGASGSTNSNQIAFNTPQLLAADNGVRYRLEVSNANGAVSGNEFMFSVVGAPAVLGGDAHTLARSDSGSVFAWGDNSAGQLGLGDNQARLEPITVPGLSGVLAVAAGRAHSLALRADGSVVAWGANAQGQLGVGTQTNHNTPQTVSGLANVVAIAAAGDQSFAVRNDGTVWAWGDNDSGQLGDGSNTDRLHPVQLTSLSGAGVAVTSVAASATHTLAVDQLGNVWAWGDNSAGQQGDTAVTVRHTPVQVAGVSGVASAAAGSGFSMAIDLNARLFAWGRNDKGQLGDGGTSNRATPQQITTTAGGGAMPVVVRIAAGNDHALALPFFGAPLAWGSNANGQLGNNALGGTARRPAPSAARRPACAPSRRAAATAWYAPTPAASTPGAATRPARSATARAAARSRSRCPPGTTSRSTDRRAYKQAANRAARPMASGIAPRPRPDHAAQPRFGASQRSSSLTACCLRRARSSSWSRPMRPTLKYLACGCAR